MIAKADTVPGGANMREPDLTAFGSKEVEYCHIL
jgi:hypothetical protein